MERSVRVALRPSGTSLPTGNPSRFPAACQDCPFLLRLAGMERSHSLESNLPDTYRAGGDRRTPLSKRRESGVELKREPTKYFDVEDRTSGTAPDFAVRIDPEIGLVVFVDGRAAPVKAARHVANGIFADAGRELPMLVVNRESITDFPPPPEHLGNTRIEIGRPRRISGEELLAAASEHALAEGDLFGLDAELRKQGDQETALAVPASGVLAIIPERITEVEIVGADKEAAEAFVGKKALTAGEAEWKTFLKKYADDELQTRKDYEASKARLVPLLERAGRYLKGDRAAQFLEGDEDDLLAALKRGAADFLARFEKEPAPDPLIEMRRRRKKEYRQGNKEGARIFERIIALPIFSTDEKIAFHKHKSSQHSWGVSRSTLEEIVNEREETATVRGLLQELRGPLQDAESRVVKMLQTDEPRLGVDERMLLAEALEKEAIVRNPFLLTRLREPDLSVEERAMVGVLEDMLRERQKPVAEVMASDDFRRLSRAGRYTLAERLKERIAEPERLRLLETRAVSISGRLGNDILVYRLRNGKLEALHDAMMRRGQETLKLRGLERPVRANQTARESFAAEFGDAFVVLPAAYTKLRAEDPEEMLRKLADLGYPLVRITVRPPQESAASPALDREAKTG